MQFTFFNINLQSGGAERQISNMVKWLTLNGHSVQLITFNPELKPAYTIPESVEMISLLKSGNKNSYFTKFFEIFYLAYRLKMTVKNKNFEAILSFNHRPNYINVLAKLIFFSSHKIILFEQIFPSRQYDRRTVKGLINWYLTKFLYKRADHVIPNSIDIGNDLYSNFGVAKKIITPIYNPVDVELIKSSASKVEEKHLKFLEKHNDKFKFIAVGRLSFQKNYDLMINSFKKSALNEKAILIIIGVGEDEYLIQNLINRLGLEDSVFLLGHTFNPFYILSNSDCYLLSSRFEGFPNSMLEAMSLGIPTIAVDCKSGPREIFSVGLDDILSSDFLVSENGILVKNFDESALSKAMQIIFHDLGLREKLSCNAKKRILDFDIDKSMNEHLAQIKKI